jgi:hypothetical protein
MLLRFRRDLDPLDLEIVERAFESAWSTLKENDALVDNYSDEELEAALRRELIEIARFNGVTDPEILRDILVADLSDRRSSATKLLSAADKKSNAPLVSG